MIKSVANQNGFTYILALTVVVIMGIMLGMVGQSWKTIKQRELEDELLFRGDQVAEIVYQRLLCKNAALPPNNPNFYWPVSSPNGTVLDDLVKTGKTESCMNGRSEFFRLRSSATIDPFTKLQWTIASSTSKGAPAPGINLFMGVKSDSEQTPIRKKFEVYDLPLLDDKDKYSDWWFTWELNSKKKYK